MARFLMAVAKSAPVGLVTGLIIDVSSTLQTVDPLPSTIIMLSLIATVITYLCVAIVVRTKADLTSSKMKKFYRSLTLIVAINVGNYIVGTIACISANYIGVTPSTQWYLLTSMTIYGNFGIAAIVPIVCLNR
uniref:DUF21 domain-containing protein n=1 Tax=Meloidogyne hapla TaxID=6305 RepID=A0A1I8BGM0_MELHA